MYKGKGRVYETTSALEKYAIAFENGPIYICGMDPDDGYRSYAYIREINKMDFLFVSKTQIASYEVLEIREENLEYDDMERDVYIEQVTNIIGDGKVIGKVWTDQSDMEYPEANIEFSCA